MVLVFHNTYNLIVITKAKAAPSLQALAPPRMSTGQKQGPWQEMIRAHAEAVRALSPPWWGPSPERSSSLPLKFATCPKVFSS